MPHEPYKALYIHIPFCVKRCGYCDFSTAAVPREDARIDEYVAICKKLSEKQRRVFDEMPLDRAVTVDYLTKTGFALGEVISALTVLEIKGLVSSLPGALYIRR